nr:LOW QUALITY PROTEIN: tripartite motif-containing protein 51-like [Vicugna pacos]
MCPLVDHEETRYLERIKRKSKEIFQQLKESQYNMDVKGKLSRGIYEELKEWCHKPDKDLLQHFETMLKNLRCLLSGPGHTDAANNSKRSKYFLAWVAEAFTSGQHFWEVAGCDNWASGFPNDSWTRKNDVVVDLKGIFLLFCIKENNQCCLFTCSPLLPQYVKRPLSHVGVFLGHEGGVVSFVRVARSSLICNFLSCSFSSPLKPFLCSGRP